MLALFLLSILCGQHISNSNGQVFAACLFSKAKASLVFVFFFQNYFFYAMHNAER